jgi:hypothetical protein
LRGYVCGNKIDVEKQGFFDIKIRIIKTKEGFYENIHIHIRADVSALKHPLIHDYTITADGKMVYQESFEGSTFIRICEMDKI